MERLAKHLIDVLISLEIRRIYGIPGDSLNAFTDEVRKREEEIEWITFRHEEAAAFAAGAEAQLSGQLTVCAGSCGPGNTHLINGLFDCHRSQAPVLAIAAQIPSFEIGSDYFQETHPEILFQQCSGFCELVSLPEQFPRLLEMAIQKAIAMKDVSVLIIPGDTAWKKIKIENPPKFFMAEPFHMHENSDRNIEEVASILNDSKKVTLFAGIGCRDAHKELLESAQILQAPIVTTLRAKEFVEHDNPFNVGLTGLLGYTSGYDALMGCDTLVMLGTDFPYRQFFPTDSKIIQVDIKAENIGRRTHVDYAIVGDVRNTLLDLKPYLYPKEDNRFLHEMLRDYEKTRQNFDEQAKESPEGRPVKPQYLTKLIDEIADPNAIFTCDVGTPTLWAARYLTMNGKRRLLGSFKHGSMANALPQAIGAQLRYPNKQVISLSGDGGLAMLLGELLTLKQYNLPIKVVVFNNHSYNFVELEMKAAGLLEYGTELVNPDFAKMAESIGIKGIKIDDSKPLKKGLQEAFMTDGPVLIEVNVDRYELAMPPRITAEEAAGFSLYLLKAVFNGEGTDLIELTRSQVNK